MSAVDEGWLPSGAHALDIGCGEGDVTAWLASRGFPSVGIDIASAAIERARARHGQSQASLEFHAADICASAPPGRQYRILIDCGCLHQIPDEDRSAYLENLLHVSAPDARMLLLMRAYRDGIPFGDPAERERVTMQAQAALASAFEIVETADTQLGRPDATGDAASLPGIAFRLCRRSAAQ